MSQHKQIEFLRNQLVGNNSGGFMDRVFKCATKWFVALLILVTLGACGPSSDGVSASVKRAPAFHKVQIRAMKRAFSSSNCKPHVDRSVMDSAKFEWWERNAEAVENFEALSDQLSKSITSQQQREHHQELALLWYGITDPDVEYTRDIEYDWYELDGKLPKVDELVYTYIGSSERNPKVCGGFLKKCRAGN